MNGGSVIERGTLPDGRPYRVWRCRETGKLVAYIGGGRGKRRNMRGLRKLLAAPAPSGPAHWRIRQ
jgi:hypothetical protein